MSDIRTIYALTDAPHRIDLAPAADGQSCQKTVRLCAWHDGRELHQTPMLVHNFIHDLTPKHEISSLDELVDLVKNNASDDEISDAIDSLLLTHGVDITPGRLAQNDPFPLADHSLYRLRVLAQDGFLLLDVAEGNDAPAALQALHAKPRSRYQRKPDNTFRGESGWKNAQGNAVKIRVALGYLDKIPDEVLATLRQLDALGTALENRLADFLIAYVSSLDARVDAEDIAFIRQTSSWKPCISPPTAVLKRAAIPA